VTPRCAVLGSPISHSLSPVQHRAAYAELGLDWEYDAREVRAEELPGFLDGLDDSWRGLSLTMPLKRAVLPLLDDVGDRARQTGAANTVLLRGGRRTGHNTDVPGAAAAIRSRTDRPVTTAVVFGGGATAASVMLALAELGCRTIRVVVRDPARVQTTLEVAGRHPARPMVEVLTFRELGGIPESLQPAIAVSTIPAQAQDENVLRVAATAPVLFDVVYHPWPTPLARLASSAGLTLVSGLDLLVHQAALQVQLMTGVANAPLDAMRAAGEAALA
jgi:shikimate dehydrogenase